MAFPTSEERITAEEARLGRRLPEDLRSRILEENGGVVETDERYAKDPEDSGWELIGVADVVQRKGRPLPVAGMVDVTESQREEWGELWEEVPEGVAVIGENGSGDLLLLMPDNTTAFWDHETQAIHPVHVALLATASLRPGSSGPPPSTLPAP